MGRFRWWIPGILVVAGAGTATTGHRFMPTPRSPIAQPEVRAVSGVAEMKPGEVIGIMASFFSASEDVTLRSAELVDLPEHVDTLDVRAMIWPLGHGPVQPEQFPHGCEPVGINLVPSASGFPPGSFESLDGLRLHSGRQFQLVFYLRPEKAGPFRTAGRVKFTFDRRIGTGTQTIAGVGGGETTVKADADPVYMDRGGFGPDDLRCEIESSRR